MLKPVLRPAARSLVAGPHTLEAIRSASGFGRRMNQSLKLMGERNGWRQTKLKSRVDKSIRTLGRMKDVSGRLQSSTSGSCRDLTGSESSPPASCKGDTRIHCTALPPHALRNGKANLRLSSAKQSISCRAKGCPTHLHWAKDERLRVAVMSTRLDNFRVLPITCCRIGRSPSWFMTLRSASFMPNTFAWNLRNITSSMAKSVEMKGFAAGRCSAESRSGACHLFSHSPGMRSSLKWAP